MNLGFNGENWFQAMDDVAKQWIIDATPINKAFTLRFRADKPDFDSGDLTKLVELHWAFANQSKTLNVIFCANIKDDAQTAFGHIQFMINSGVNIIAVEFGNEVYSGTQANFIFQTYKNWFEPLRLLMETNYPNIPCLVFLAPRPKDSGVLGGRNDHKTFNDEAISYINSKEHLHPTVHIYLNDRECPTTIESPTKTVIQADTYYPELQEYYNNVLTEAEDNYPTLWDNTLNYIHTRCPGKEIHITEWGFDNYGDIKNTLALGKIAFQIWYTYSKDTRITSLLQHNGISMAGPGMIFPVHPTLDTPEPSGGKNKRRVDYWIYYIFRMFEDYQVNNFYQELGPGKYVFTSPFTPTLSQNCVVSSTSNHFINGLYLYSSAGATEWMAKNSVRSYEVSSIGEYDATKVNIGFTAVVVDQILPVNIAPVAVTSGTTKCFIGETASFSGAGSYDEDGQIVSYEWYDNKGQVVSNSSSLNYLTTVEGVFDFLLVVTDDKGDKGYSTISLTVNKKVIKPKPWYCRLFPWICN